MAFPAWQVNGALRGGFRQATWAPGPEWPFLASLSLELGSSDSVRLFMDTPSPSGLASHQAFCPHWGPPGVFWAALPDFQGDLFSLVLLPQFSWTCLDIHSPAFSLRSILGIQLTLLNGGSDRDDREWTGWPLIYPL